MAMDINFQTWIGLSDPAFLERERERDVLASEEARE